MAEIFPHVRRGLEGWEKTVLDFGCGPGRFFHRLAELSGGRTIAVDPVARFLSMAPRSPAVEYRKIERGRLPVESQSIDLARVCLTENTSDFQNKPHWTYRSVARYQELFDFAALAHAHDYEEAGERISVLIGRAGPEKI